MGILSGLILPFTFLAMAQEPKTCSNENLELLLEKVSALQGYSGSRDARIMKIFLDPNYSKMHAEDIKKRYFDSTKQNSGEISKIFKEIDAIVKKHPECDRKQMFGNTK